MFGRVGAPRKGSHEDVIALRLAEVSASETGERTGYSARHVQEITATFSQRILPRIKELHREGFDPGVIAGEVGYPESIVAAAVSRFGQSS